MECFKRFNFRLEPVGRQREQFDGIARLNRRVWNEFLEFREDAYLAARSAGGSLPWISAFDMIKMLTQIKKADRSLFEAPADTLVQTLVDLQTAFEQFFSGEKKHPRFRGRYSQTGFRFPSPKQFQIMDDWIDLPKVGWLRFRKSQPIDGKIKSATVLFKNGHWELSVLVSQKIRKPKAPKGAGVGMDSGVANSLATSDGKFIHFPVPSEKEERFGRFLARSVSRKQKGSNRRRKANARLAKLKRRAVDRRRHGVHQVVNDLVRKHPVIAKEKLVLKSMTRSAKGTLADPGRNVRAKSGLNRSLLKQAHGEFGAILKYKCERAGVELVEVPAPYTSQRCSCCGFTAAENRPTQAVFSCVACKVTMHADLNAARNIAKAAGLAVSARGGTGLPGQRTANPKRAVRRLSA